KRALNEHELMLKAATFNLNGNCFPSVIDAYHAALAEAGSKDFIFIGGSSYVVADLLSSLHK
ncbi:MAG: bifunctional folylpolyglutamate synthase/dihydrofolate synthase, partial [Bacteroidaceae bacterium]